MSGTVVIIKPDGSRTEHLVESQEPTLLMLQTAVNGYIVSNGGRIMNLKEFVAWYNRAIWNLAPDFPAPSNRIIVRCKPDCKVQHWKGHRCKGWHFEDKPVKGKGRKS